MDRQRSATPAEMYERYFVPGIFARWTPLLLERAAPRRGERVLDLACGTGVVARHVAPLVGEEGRVVGLDTSPDMLKVAGALATPQGAAIEWHEGDAASLPDGPFDLILCQQGLQFFPDRRAALIEMHRVLRTGGRVALSTWKGLDHQPLYSTLLNAEARYLNTSLDIVAGPPFSLGDAAELRRLLEEAEFNDIVIAPVTYGVRFPEPERFVTLTTLASAAVLPEFLNMDEAERSVMVETISREIDASVREYVDGDEVSFPMHAHITVAYAR